MHHEALDMMTAEDRETFRMAPELAAKLAEMMPGDAMLRASTSQIGAAHRLAFRWIAPLVDEEKAYFAVHAEYRGDARGLIVYGVRGHSGGERFESIDDAAQGIAAAWRDERDRFCTGYADGSGGVEHDADDPCPVHPEAGAR